MGLCSGWKTGTYSWMAHDKNKKRRHGLNITWYSHRSSSGCPSEASAASAWRPSPPCGSASFSRSLVPASYPTPGLGGRSAAVPWRVRAPRTRHSYWWRSEWGASPPRCSSPRWPRPAPSRAAPCRPDPAGLLARTRTASPHCWEDSGTSCETQWNRFIHNLHIDTFKRHFIQRQCIISAWWKENSLNKSIKETIVVESCKFIFCLYIGVCNCWPTS